VFANFDLKKRSHRKLDPTTIWKALLQHRIAYLPGYKKRVTALIEMCKKSGAAPVLLTQPKLLGAGVDPETGIDLGTLAVQKKENGDLIGQTIALYNECLREIGKNQEVPVIDLAAQMPKSSKYYYDFDHFTREGAEKVAALVAIGLLPFLQDRFPQFLANPGFPE